MVVASFADPRIYFARRREWRRPKRHSAGRLRAARTQWPPAHRDSSAPGLCRRRLLRRGRRARRGRRTRVGRLRGHVSRGSQSHVMAPANPPLCRTTSEAAEKVASHVACALVGMYTLMMHGGIERKRKRMRDCEHSRDAGVGRTKRGHCSPASGRSQRVQNETPDQYQGTRRR